MTRGNLPSSGARLALDRSALLAGLDVAARDMVLRGAQSRSAAKGAVLFRQGDPPARLHLLLTGGAKVSRVTPRGVPLTVRHLGPGEVAGCVAIFCGTPYPATATLTEDSTLISWTCGLMSDLLRQYPELRGNALGIVGERNAQMLRRIEELSTEPAQSRVARALVALANGAGPHPVARVSRQDLAELTATTLHTVSRLISAWERMGWVAGGRQRIAVLDAEALRKIAPAAENPPDL